MELQQDSLGSYGIDCPLEESFRTPTRAITLVGCGHQYEPNKSLNNLQFRDVLPNIEGYGWEASSKGYGPGRVLEYWQHSQPGKWNKDTIEHEDIPGSGGMFINGSDDYLRQYALTELDYPGAYTRFDDGDVQYRWSADGLTHIWGRFLKKCVRLANGDGRISTSNTELVLCSPGVVVVAGPRGIFYVPLWTNDVVVEKNTLPDPPTAVHHSVHGIEVPEENPTLREGLGRYLKLRADSPYPDVKRHQKLQVDTSGIAVTASHTFRTADGSVTVSGGALDTLTNHQQSLDDIAGVHRQTATHHDIDDEMFTVVCPESGLVGPIGAETTVTTKEKGEEIKVTGLVGGYRLEWNLAEAVRGFERREPTEQQLHVSVALLTESGEIHKHQVKSDSFGLN